MQRVLYFVFIFFFLFVMLGVKKSFTTEDVQGFGSVNSASDVLSPVTDSNTNNNNFNNQSQPPESKPRPHIPQQQQPPVRPKPKRPKIRVFIEDFETYGLGQTAPFGVWRSKRATAHIEEGVQLNGQIGKILKVEGGDYIYLMKNWKDYIFEVDWKGGEPQIFFRTSSNMRRGYYITRGSGYRSPVKLFKFAGSQKQKIAESKAVDVQGGKWATWKIEVKRYNIRIYLDGLKLIDVFHKDRNLLSGGIALGSEYGGVYYDNLKVRILQ